MSMMSPEEAYRQAAARFTWLPTMDRRPTRTEFVAYYGYDWPVPEGGWAEEPDQ